MLFSRIASFVACSLALGGVTLAKPAMLAKRADLTAVQQVMTDLKSSADTIIPQIQNLAASNSATNDSAVPLVDQLIAKFNNASSAIHSIATGAPVTASTELEKRQQQTLQTIAQTTSDILTEMTNAMTGLVKSSNTDLPVLSGRISTLYTSTSTLLTQLSAADTGLSGLLGSLLGSLLPLVTGLLGGLLGGLGGGSGGGLGSLLSLVLGLLGL